MYKIETQTNRFIDILIDGVNTIDDVIFLSNYCGVTYVDGDGLDTITTMFKAISRYIDFINVSEKTIINNIKTILSNIEVVENTKLYTNEFVGDTYTYHTVIVRYIPLDSYIKANLFMSYTSLDVYAGLDNKWVETKPVEKTITKWI